ncbi:MAG: hypothetical protein ACOVNU_11625 [Candidatus Kapaibacteriota bacterium]
MELSDAIEILKMKSAINSPSKLANAIDIVLKRIDELYSEEVVELIANEMANWAIDNIGNINAQSGEKFDEVLSKYKTQ